MSTPNTIRTALSKAGIPATLMTLRLDEDTEITVALTVTVTPPGDIHQQLRPPDHNQASEAFRRLQQWSGMIEVC